MLELYQIYMLHENCEFYCFSLNFTNQQPSHDEYICLDKLNLLLNIVSNSN